MGQHQETPVANRLDARICNEFGFEYSIAGGLPEFHLPMVPFNLQTLWIIGAVFARI